MSLDDEWNNFMSSSYDEDEICEENTNECSMTHLHLRNADMPKCGDIYISTKTNIAYLNVPIELNKIFWNIPIIPYFKPCNGIIKKQIKFNSFLKEELEFIKEKLKTEPYYEEYVISHIDNPTGRIKFKDIRKVSIGISKKDIMSYRLKKKSAFYNCIVLILRIKIGDIFKEFHVKVFNTGKLEIPGIQCESSFQLILNEILDVLQPHINCKLCYKENSNETVLINSNFNCGFFINRELLYDILKTKYNIHAIFDPCSYPGIQCKFYYNPDLTAQIGSQIKEEEKHLYKNMIDMSFMIFRTGSILIVGKCDESVLMSIYEFLKNMLTAEYKNICQHVNLNEINLKEKKTKLRKKHIIIELTSSTT